MKLPSAKDLSTHVPALDGLRGLAVLFVIAFHSRAPFDNTSEIPWLFFRFLGLGWSGVDLFFVLSGFLITGILLDTQGNRNYFKVFYARRALRIFPLYLGYVLLVLGVFQLLGTKYFHSNPWRSTNPLYYLTYTMNLKPLGGADDQWLDHLWSLAIEEQFYLVWPAVVLFCSRRSLRWVCGAIIVSALAARIAGYGMLQNPEWLYRLTPCHLDSLGIGALVALGVRDFAQLTARCARMALPVAALGFAEVALVSPDPVWSDAAMRTVGVSLIAVFYGSILVTIVTSPAGILSRGCSWGPLRSVGKYSYAMYVLHSAPFRVVAPMLRAATGGPTPWILLLTLKYLFFPALVIFAYGMARISYRILEEPFLRLKRHFVYTPTEQPAEASALALHGEAA